MNEQPIESHAQAHLRRGSSLVRLFVTILTLTVVLGAATTFFLFRASNQMQQSADRATDWAETTEVLHAALIETTVLNETSKRRGADPESTLNSMGDSTTRIAADLQNLFDRLAGEAAASQDLQQPVAALQADVEWLKSALQDSDEAAGSAAIQQRTAQMTNSLEQIEDVLHTAQLAELTTERNEADNRRNRAIALSAFALLVVGLSTLAARRLSAQQRRLHDADVNRFEESEEHAAALRAANHRLALSNRDLAGFAYVASHDLQEPLRKIIAFGERLERRSADSLDETSRDYLNRMTGAATRMRQLIEDLLSYARTASTPAQLGQANMATIAADVVADLEIAIEESGATVTVGYLPTIQADPTQMRQVLQNVIGNALKFRKPDVAPVIRVQMTRLGNTHPVASRLAGIHPKAGSWFELTISDNGVGFDQQFADKVFLVFQRLHGRDDYAGSGLGLSVARRVIERHTGDISVTSKLGEGTTIRCVLPLCQPEQAGASVGVGPASQAGPAAPIGRNNVDQHSFSTNTLSVSATTTTSNTLPTPGADRVTTGAQS
jgi:signal transduction histidine kinase